MDIRIDLKKVTNVNNELIPIITRLSIVHRSLNLTKWKLDENMERYIEIKEKIENISNRVNETKWKKEKIYTITGECISDYMEAEGRLYLNAYNIKEN